MVRRIASILFVGAAIFFDEQVDTGQTASGTEFLDLAQANAEAGDSSAQLELARIFLDGHRVPRDRTVAYFWFNVAAGRGS